MKTQILAILGILRIKTVHACQRGQPYADRQSDFMNCDTCNDRYRLTSRLRHQAGGFHIYFWRNMTAMKGRISMLCYDTTSPGITSRL